MGSYFNATDLVETDAGSPKTHLLSLLTPLDTDAGQQLVGLYWHGVQDDYTQNATATLV